MSLMRSVLWPFSLVYGGIMQLRNAAYDCGVFSSSRFPIPVIAVGNLTVGGTGKTPHVEYLLRLLQKRSVAVLSRGYKRKSRGFVLADEQATAALVGDEPFQYHRDFPGITVAVSERRVEGIANLLKRTPAPEVIVLDDAMQHRPVQPSLSIMLTDYHRLFYNDHVLPAGLLREPKQGARRADIIVISKCPDKLPISEQQAITQAVHRYSRPDVPVFFSRFSYGAPVPVGSVKIPTKKIILLTGIANAQPLIHYLEQQQYTVVHHVAFADHYSYTLSDLQKLQQLITGEDEVCIMTTRKDAVKLTDGPLLEQTQKLPVFYLPIEVSFLSDEDKFCRLVLQHVPASSL